MGLAIRAAISEADDLGTGWLGLFKYWVVISGNLAISWPGNEVNLLFAGSAFTSTGAAANVVQLTFNGAFPNLRSKVGQYRGAGLSLGALNGRTRELSFAPPTTPVPETSTMASGGLGQPQIFGGFLHFLQAFKV